jgi:hypothetical protein
MKPMMGKGAENMLSRAAAEQPKSGHTKPAGGQAKPVGQETKAEVKAVQDGGSKAEAAGNPLRGAVKELHTQHPHKYDDLGPHHGGTDHIRHQPMGGLKPGSNV